MKKTINIATIVSCSLVIVLAAVMFFVAPDKSMSQKENRALAQLPSFDTGKLFSGEYTKELSLYISDQFPARDVFISAKAYSELLLLKGENNGVIYAQNDTLVARDEINENRLQENLQSVVEFKNATDIPTLLAILPRTIDVFSEYLPDPYPTENDRQLWQEYFDTTEQLDLEAVNLYDGLCRENNYYHTDHHYDTYGAYQTYVLLGDKLGYQPMDIDFFKKKRVSNDFCGTSMRKSGFYMAPKDEITLFRYDGDDAYSIIADGNEIPMYDTTKLDTTDQYAVFLGGNHARVDIKSGDGRPKMLIIRDSFADSLAPFLALHYDLVMIDLRYFTQNVQQLAIKENVQQVLILESISEFVSAKNISFLERGVEN